MLSVMKWPLEGFFGINIFLGEWDPMMPTHGHVGSIAVREERVGVSIRLEPRIAAPSNGAVIGHAGYDAWLGCIGAQDVLLQLGLESPRVYGAAEA